MKRIIPVFVIAALEFTACSEKSASTPTESVAVGGAATDSVPAAVSAVAQPVSASAPVPGANPAGVAGTGPVGAVSAPAAGPLFTPSPEMVKAAAADKLNIPTDFKADLSGLKYAMEIEGSGLQPKEGQTVKVNYIGWLTDGHKFDSSKKGEPFKFKLGKGQVIDGWDMGVAKMKVGGKAWLVLPADLAYGEGGSLPDIPGNATLLFHVELLGIE